MILSRRSFLKVAGLTVVAAASASMFTGCGITSTTPIELVAETGSAKEFSEHVAEIGKKKLVEDTLKKDYKMDGKEVIFDTTKSFEFKAQDPSHHVLTITFKVKDKA